MKTMLINHKSESDIWTIVDPATGAPMGTVYREIGASDANAGQTVYKAFKITYGPELEAHFATLGDAQAFIGAEEARDVPTSTPVASESAEAHFAAIERTISDTRAFFARLGVDVTAQRVNWALECDGWSNAERSELIAIWAAEYGDLPDAPDTRPADAPLPRFYADAARESITAYVAQIAELERALNDDASSAQTRELITACLHFAQSAAVIAGSLAGKPAYLESAQTRADAALIAARADVSILRCLRYLGAPVSDADLSDAEARERAAHDHNNNVIDARYRAVRETARALWPVTAAQSDAAEEAN